MAEVGTAFVSLVPSARGFGKKMQGEVGPQVENSGKSIGSKLSGALGKTLKGGAIAAGGAITGILGTAFVKGFSRLQGIDQARAKLAGLGHEAKSVDRIMDNALGAVKGTAFGLDEAATVAASAVAAGIKPGQALERTLTLVGDAATIAGTDMGSMGAIFNKVAASNKVQMDVINQLHDRGVPALSLLADQLGVTAEEASKMASSGKINFSTFQKAMEKGLGGAAQKSGKTFQGALANMNAALGRLGASALEGVFSKMPALFGKATGALDKLGPAAQRAGERLSSGLVSAGRAIQRLWPSVQKMVQAWAPTLKSVGREALNLGKAIGSQLLPAVEKFLQAATALGKFIAGIPGPLKEIGVQAGVAALVMPRLAGAATAVGTSFSTTSARVKQFYAELTYAETRAQQTSMIMGRLQGALRMAAGVAGMVGLAQGAERAGTATGALATAAGGAALGFSVGGPWGAAAGTVAGVAKALWDTKRASDNAREANRGLSQAQLDAEEAARQAQSSMNDYRLTLDDVTGAITNMTKARVHDHLIETGALRTAQLYGISTRDLTQAALGRSAAEGRLTRQVQAAIKQSPIHAAEISSVAHAAGVSAARIDQESNAIKRRTQDTQSWKKALGGVPPEVTTRLKQLDYQPNLKQINHLARRYELTPKQVNTILKATGTEAAVKKVDGVTKALKETAKVKPRPDNWNPSMADLLGVGQRNVKKSSNKIGSDLRGATNTKVSPTWANALGATINNAKGQASSGSSGIGSALKTGFSSGFAGADGLWSSQVRTAVGSAIAAGRRAAQTRSPSRKTMKLGKDMADGLTVGLSRQTGRVVAAARKAVGKSVKAMKKALKKAKQQLNRVTKQVDLFKSIRDQVKSAFSPDLFSGSLAEFLRNMQSQLANNKAVQQAFAVLRRKGAKGDFLTSLLSSGNSQLILALAGADAKALKQAQADWNAVQSSASTIGNQVAKADVGTGLAQLNNQMKRLNKTVNNLDKRIGREVSKGINKGAKKGKRNGKR